MLVLLRSPSWQRKWAAHLSEVEPQLSSRKVLAVSAATVIGALLLINQSSARPVFLSCRQSCSRRVLRLRAGPVASALPCHGKHPAAPCAGACIGSGCRHRMVRDRSPRDAHVIASLMPCLQVPPPCDASGVGITENEAAVTAHQNSAAGAPTPSCGGGGAADMSAGWPRHRARSGDAIRALGAQGRASARADAHWLHAHLSFRSIAPAVGLARRRIEATASLPPPQQFAHRHATGAH